LTIIHPTLPAAAVAAEGVVITAVAIGRHEKQPYQTQVDDKQKTEIIITIDPIIMIHQPLLI